MIKYLKFIFLYVGLLLLCINVRAEPIDSVQVNDDTQEITIAGNIGVSEVDVALQILDATDKAKLSNITSKEIAGLLVYAYQTKSGQNGEYSFDYKMTRSTGNYLIRIAWYDATGPVAYDLYYINPKEKTEILSQINTAKAAKDLVRLKEILDNKGSALGLNLTEYKNLQSKGIDIMPIFDGLILLPDFSSVEDFIKAFDVGVMIRTINTTSSDKIETILKNNEVLLGLKGKAFYEKTYANDLGATEKAIVMAGLLKTPTYIADTDFDAAFKELTILTAISNNDWINFGTILSDNYDIVDTASYKDYNNLASQGTSYAYLKSDVAKKMAKTSYSSLSEFSTIFSAKVKQAYDTINSQKDSTGSTGGGGGAGSGGTTKKIEVDSTPVMPLINSQKEYFTDLSNVSWAKDAINALASKGIIKGKGEGIFSPDQEVTREELVAMIVNSFGFTNQATETDFSDAVKGSWYYDYLVVAQKMGLAKGTEDNLFGVGKMITRQEMCTFAFRAATADKISFSQNDVVISYADDIDDYAVEAVKILSSAGIVNGTGNRLFSPHNFATRAQAARVLYDLLKYAGKI